MQVCVADWELFTERSLKLSPLGREKDSMLPTFGYIAPATTLELADLAARDSEIVELPLLLPRWQALALETVAEGRGLTPAQMLRQLIGDSIRDQANLAR
jgi:hypothetical protein